MGAWGPGNFENDDAMDFLVELPAGDIIPVVFVLEEVSKSSGHLEVYEASVALAAAEIIAGIKGAPPENPPDAFVGWLTANTNAVTPILNALALRAIQRIRTDSELLELWSDSDKVQQWHAALENLEARLRK